VTEEEFKKFKLTPLVRYTAKIAEITNMVWFSSEIAIDRKNGETRFLSIDHVNDQCDMDTDEEEEIMGVPKRIVKFTAYAMVHAAHSLIKKMKKSSGRKYTILLKEKGNMGVHGLGYAPGLLVNVHK
jgi:hypothetical protein